MYIPDDAVVQLPAYRVTDFVTHHAAGPQDSDSEDDEDDKEEPTEVESEILAAARHRWESPQISPSTSAPLPPTLPQNTAHALGSDTNVDHTNTAEVHRQAQTAKKKKLHHKSRQIKREAICETKGVSKAPKAVVLACVCQASPIPINLRMQSDALPVASTSWMGLREPPPLPFEPEPREYSLTEVRKIPGMRVVDWQGYIMDSSYVYL
jgi:hypothetical protein